MGWLFMRSLGGHQGPREYLDHQFTNERPERRTRVLRSALVRFRTYYAAVEETSANGEREVWACVCLVKYNLRGKEGYIFGYKDMTEHMGPCEAQCPVAILDLLTPTANENAVQWRAACRAAAAARCDKPKLRHGQIVTFSAPLTFADGKTHQVLRVHVDERFNRRIRFRSIDGAGLYRIPGIRELDYSVEADPTRQEGCAASPPQLL